MISYPAIFHKEDSHFWVEFPDFDYCVTQGESLQEAKQMAKDALTAVLKSMDSRNIPIPKASALQGDNIFYIEPELNTLFTVLPTPTEVLAGDFV